MSKLCLLCCGTAGMADGACAEDAVPALCPWDQNPWYWSYHGEPVMLLGGSDDDNLFQWPEDRLLPQLDRLQEAGGNVIRNTMSDRQDFGFEIYPFLQRPDGQYDLARWNVDYWKRFECMLRETAKRGMFVQIEIWDRFDFTDAGGKNHWQRHPYNPKNNLNYGYEESGFATHYPDHPSRNLQPFFFTTPGQCDNTVVLPIQQRFVDKLLEHSLRYDHVLYCVDNETKAEEEWGHYWADYVKRRAAAEGRQVMVTEMWDDWDLRAKRHRRTFDHPELYDFVDVSQNNQNSGRKHWDNFLFVRSYLASRPRPMNTTKTYGADGNKFGHTDQDAVERFWRHLLAGAASMRFHRPPAGLGLNDRAAASLRAARKLGSVIPLWTVEPADELLSRTEENGAYLAAQPGHAYALYLTAGGMANVDLSDGTKSFIVRWIQIDTGEWGPTQDVTGGDVTWLEAPDKGNWAAAITPARNARAATPSQTVRGRPTGPGRDCG